MLDLISCFPDDLSISEGVNSGKSSMSSGSDQSHCTSFSRLSFEILTNSPEEHNPATLMPRRRSSDSSFQTISGSTAAESSAVRPAGPSFRDFSLLRQIGSGDIGKVYLCRLRGGGDEEARARLYAMKVVDNEALAVKNKVRRAETERKILRMLNHPFLPTLYAEFQVSHFSCVVMEYCPGGDLHSLRHKLPHKRFSLSSAKY